MPFSFLPKFNSLQCIFLCFQVHPSAVDLETSRFHNKMTLHVFGKEKRIMKAAQEKGALIIDNGMIKGKSRIFIFFFF